MAWSGSRGAASGTLRRGPTAAGAGDAAVRGSSPRRRASARKARRMLPPRNGETPATLAAYHRSPGRSTLPVARASSRGRFRPSGVARRRCALDDCEENPHSYAPARPVLRRLTCDILPSSDLRQWLVSATLVRRFRGTSRWGGRDWHWLSCRLSSSAWTRSVRSWTALRWWR